ncbi:restriction endonuclease subunit S [Shewanella algae]|uniref:restriction endonuclease subunit S n=1 Tax=Shewanella algae TaxID=38313 RepID=UPI0031F48B7D
MSFDLPKGWTSQSIENAMEAIIDYRGKTPKKSDSGIPLITAKIVKSGRLETPTEFIPEEDYDAWMVRGLPQAGDVVLTTEAPLGEVAQLDDANVALAQRIVTLRGKPDLLVNDYLKYLLQSHAVQQQLDARGSGSTVKGIKQSELRKVVLSLPPIAQQRSIAGTLKSLDDKITLNTQTNQTLEQMAQALFKSWFVDFDPVIDNALDSGFFEREFAGEDILKPLAQRVATRQALREATAADTDASAIGRLPPETRALFPDSFEKHPELGWIPKGWDVGTVLDLFELHRGFDLPKSKRVDGEYPVYAAGGFHGTHNEFKMEPPGIITGRSGVIGNVYLSLEKYWPLNTALYIRDYRLSGPYYAYHLLRSIDLKVFNSGSAVPSLNRNYVHSLAALCPPEALLQLFESAATPIFAKIAANNKQSETLASHRDTLLPKLLSGELNLAEIHEKTDDEVTLTFVEVRDGQA